MTGIPGVTRPASAKAVPGYRAAHLRIAKANGPASDYPCLLCGGPAREWAYEGGCPDEHRQTVRDWPLPYCLHPWHYHPMCRTDHLAYDRSHPHAC